MQDNFIKTKLINEKILVDQNYNYKELDKNKNTRQ